MPDKKDHAIEKPPLYKLDGVEIFSEGKWNNEEYNSKDLDDMVDAFNETVQELRPFAKLGHDNGQKLIQKDGLPAAGWISKIYRKGSKLLADFVDVPEKIYQLLVNKAYRRVSSEIFWNLNHNGKVYRRLIHAVAFLGGDMPAVTCLDDILSLYGIKADGIIKQTYDQKGDMHLCVYDLNKKENKMEKELEALKAKYGLLEENLSKKESELKEYSEKTNKELEELKKYKESSEKEKAQLIKEKNDVECEKFLDDLAKDKLITKASRPYVKSLLGEELKEYTINDKKVDKMGLLKEVFSMHKEAYSSVNFEENSQNDDSRKGNDLDQKIKKYMLDNKCSYSEAYRTLATEK